MPTRVISDSLSTRLRLPEMRPFYLLVVIFLVFLIVDFVYLPTSWAIAAGVFFLASAGVAFWLSLRLAKLNFEVKTASGRLEKIVDNLEDGVIAYDGDFKILVFNPAAERIFGLNQPEVLGQSFGPERVREARFRLLAQVMFPSLAPMVIPRSEPGMFPQVVDLSFSEPERQLRVSTDRIIDPGGQIVGFLKLVRDRTREVDLLRSKSEFIAVAAHQLRTPLTAIHWVFEGLAKKELPAEDKEAVASGLNAATRMLKIVNDLLDVAKIEEGRYGYNLQPVNFVDFLAKLLSGAEAVAKQYSVKLYFDRGPVEGITLTIDPDKLSIAVSNLLDNAIKYNVPNGSVTVKLEQLADKPYLQVSIKDTGIGIPPEDVKKLFSKFFRAENVVKKETAGSGLGLYIAKNIINRHGGVIWAESTLGRGTTFYFTLPLDPNLIPKAEAPLIE